MNVNLLHEMTPEPPRESWWKRGTKRFATHWARDKAVYRAVGTLAAFCAFGFLMVYLQAHKTNETARANDRRHNEAEIYGVKLIAWQKASADFDTCKATVTRSDANRAQWESEAAKWDENATKAQAAGSPQPVIDFFHDWADSIRNGPVLSNPGKTLAECHDPGPEPQPPTT